MASRTRREFLKISAATIAGGTAAYVGLPALRSRASSVADPGTEGERVVPTFCELCFWKCGLLAHVRDGVVTKLEGNPLHPLSNGRLCPRGAGGVGAIYDEDRLRQPLIRVRDGDRERWQPASWDEALQLVADRLSAVRDEHGAGAIALYSHGHGGVFFKTLAKAIGTGVLTAPSFDQCRGPRQVGFELTYGRGVGGTPELIDLPHARCVAFLGNHLGENMHNTTVQDMAAARARGATFITVDPRYSLIASKSRYWLPIKPGTDIALLLAWAHVLIDEDLYDARFIEANAYGFEEFRAAVADKTPEWAYLETGIEPDVIRATARELGHNAPAAMVAPGRHVVWYGDDTQRLRAVALVNALLGNWGKPGGFYLGQRVGVERYPLPPLPEPVEFEPEHPWVVTKHPCAQDVCEASRTEGDRAPVVRAWIVYGCNIPLSLPQPEKVIQTMRELDFVVAIDTMPAEVTGYADVVLPECTYLERWDDLHNPSFRTPYVALRQPAVEPLYDTRPGYEIAKGIAERMGLGRYFPWESIEQYLQTRLDASGLSFDDLRRDGVIVREGGSIYDESLEMAFATPTGKIEFVSTVLAVASGAGGGAAGDGVVDEARSGGDGAEGEPAGDGGAAAGGEGAPDASEPVAASPVPGLDPIPRYTPPAEPPPGMFRLLFGRAPTHSFSRTTNNRELLKVFPENELWLNAAMGRSLGLREGDRVMLRNQDGATSGPIRLRVTERIRSDCVYMVHGFGRDEPRLTAVHGKGASDSALITHIVRDPVMGGTGMNVNFVTLEKA